ncbi:unnamed protein product [Brassica rapa subsp. narinosa]
MPNYLAPFDPTKKKKMTQQIFDGLQSSFVGQNSVIKKLLYLLNQGESFTKSKTMVWRMLYLILKELSPKAESRPELEFLNSNMIFANLAKLPLM